MISVSGPAFEAASECRAGAGEARFDGRDGAGQDEGYLFKGHALEVVEREDGLVVGGESQKGGARFGVVGLGGARRVGRGGAGEAAEDGAQAGAATGPAVDAVGRDAQEPDADRDVGAAVGIDRAVRGKEDVARQVFGEVGVAGAAVDGAGDGAVVMLVEGAEGGVRDGFCFGRGWCVALGEGRRERRVEVDGCAGRAGDGDEVGHAQYKSRDVRWFRGRAGFCGEGAVDKKARPVRPPLAGVLGVALNAVNFLSVSDGQEHAIA